MDSCNGKIEGEVMRTQAYEEYVTQCIYDETLERLSEKEYWDKVEENS